MIFWNILPALDGKTAAEYNLNVCAFVEIVSWHGKNKKTAPSGGGERIG